MAMLLMCFPAMLINGPNPKIMLATVPTICWDGVFFAPLFGQAKSGNELTHA